MPAPIPDALRPLDASDDDVLYVADANLNVVCVNPAWRSFAGSNNGDRLLGTGWNRNLLANFSGSERLRWQAIYEALLSGRLEFHEENFMCPSPVERRTYLLRIERHVDNNGILTHLSHHAIRLDRKNKATVLAERLSALDGDTEATIEAYKNLVTRQRVEAASLNTAEHFAPLHDVGGDLLWHRHWADGSIDLVIADAMGHGIDAARLAAKMFMLLQAYADRKKTVAGNVAILNGALHALPQNPDPTTRGPLFATGLYLRIDQTMQSLSICSFGHTGPIFSTSGPILLKPGLPVGILPNEMAGHWPETGLPFAEHGRRFVIYTDGLSEQFNIAGEMFGDSGIERVFRRTVNWPLPQMVDAIRAEADAFRGTALIKDDQALLAVEVGAA
jgi:serine phosphatase RsbU (regulator of sigma subunit)